MAVPNADQDVEKPNLSHIAGIMLNKAILENNQFLQKKHKILVVSFLTYKNLQGFFVFVFLVWGSNSGSCTCEAGGGTTELNPRPRIFKF